MADHLAADRLVVKHLAAKRLAADRWVADHLAVDRWADLLLAESHLWAEKRHCIQTVQSSRSIMRLCLHSLILSSPRHHLIRVLSSQHSLRKRTLSSQHSLRKQIRLSLSSLLHLRIPLRQVPSMRHLSLPSRQLLHRSRSPLLPRLRRRQHSPRLIFRNLKRRLTNSVFLQVL